MHFCVFSCIYFCRGQWQFRQCWTHRIGTFTQKYRITQKYRNKYCKWGTEYNIDNNNNIFLNSSFHWTVEVNLFWKAGLQILTHMWKLKPFQLSSSSPGGSGLTLSRRSTLTDPIPQWWIFYRAQMIEVSGNEPTQESRTTLTFTTFNNCDNVNKRWPAASAALIR